MATSIGILRSVLTLDVAGFGKGMSRAVKDVSRFQRTMGKLQRGLAFFGGAFGVTFGATAAIRGITRRIDQIGNLADEADKTGVSLRSLGVDLNQNAIVKVRDAAKQMDALRANWARFRDEVIAANIAGPMSRWLDAVNSGRGTSLKEIIAGKPATAEVKRPARTALEVARQDALDRLAETRRMRFRTPMDYGRQATNIAAQRAAEQADAFASARATQENNRQMNAIRVREANLRRRMLAGRNFGDETLNRLLGGGPELAPMTTGGRNPLWDMVRQSPNTSGVPAGLGMGAPQRELQELNDTQKKMLQEIQRQNEIWNRELMRRANEAEEWQVGP